MTKDDMDPNDTLSPFEPDPRIKEMVEYATTGIELVLNAEYLLDEWVTAALLRDASWAHQYRRFRMTPEQKFLLVAHESGMSDDDEFGGRQVFGVLLDLYRLRARARCLPDEDLTAGVLESAVRHWGEEEREEQEDSHIPIFAARDILAGHLAFAESWLSYVDDQGTMPGSEALPEEPYPDWEVWYSKYNPARYDG